MPLAPILLRPTTSECSRPSSTAAWQMACTVEAGIEPHANNCFRQNAKQNAKPPLSIPRSLSHSIIQRHCRKLSAACRTPKTKWFEPKWLHARGNIYIYIYIYVYVYCIRMYDRTRVQCTCVCVYVGVCARCVVEHSLAYASCATCVCISMLDRMYVRMLHTSSIQSLEVLSDLCLHSA